MGIRGIGIEFEGALIFAFGRAPLPLRVEAVGKSGMGFGQRIVDGDCLLRSGTGFGYRLARCHRSVVGNYVIVIGEAQIGESVVGIFFDGLGEIIASLVEGFGRPLLPIETSLEIELVGLRVAGSTLDDWLRSFIGQTFAQLRGDGASDLVLNGEYVG